MPDVTTIKLPMAAERENYINTVFRGLSRQLFGFIRKRVSSTEDAEDILQEVFYQFAGNTEPIEQASSWLYRVAKNKITDNYRKKKLPLADDLFGSAESEDGIAEWKEILLANDSNPEMSLLRNIFWEELKAALDELPENQREVFINHEIEDISFREMEEKTGVPVATLITRKRYAVLHLRKRLANLKNELLNK
jgi:RNA polymerase sigma factor (sigma-70 family)